MEIRVIDQSEITKFLKHQPVTPGLFLQTPNWLEFERRRGRGVDWLGFFVDGKLVGVASVVTFELYQSLYYAYCPRGPVVTENKYLNQALRLLVGQYKGKVLFLRVEPPIIIKPKIQNPKSEMQRLGFRKTDAVQPEATVTLDLKKSEEQLLSEMHHKTRYNINLAERKGVKFRWGTLQDFDTFWSLLQETAERGHFRTHVLAHYQMLLEGMDKKYFGDEDFVAKLALAEYKGQPLAVSLQLACFGVVTYLHGASSREHKELMAPNLMHWRIIQEAKQASMEFYDMWGITPVGATRPGWAGFTRFKLGFSEERIEYAGTYDYPYLPLAYLGYQAGRWVRNLSGIDWWERWKVKQRV